ncbi:MAG: Crp/Fnr family transcriptional regulator [Candidatus Marinimicrobia bacterium]|nr:Crp/Fnr family transcriptional regulator [Candidatus Neomarinimicrobiota bacterium]
MKIKELRKIPIFYRLDDDSLENISQIVSTRVYNKGEVILLEEDTGNNLYLIKSGRVKVTRINSDGDEVILTMLGEGEFFGEMAIFGGVTRSANVSALEKSEVLILTHQDFLSLLKKHPDISIYLLEEMASRLRKSDQLIKDLSLSNAEHKIAMSIIRLSEELGKIKQGQVEIEDFPYQKDIANMAGTSRETVSRTLKKFEKKGYIEKKGRKLIIFDYHKFVEEFS